MVGQSRKRLLHLVVADIFLVRPCDTAYKVTKDSLDSQALLQQRRQAPPVGRALRDQIVSRFLDPYGKEIGRDQVPRSYSEAKLSLICNGNFEVISPGRLPRCQVCRLALP